VKKLLLAATVLAGFAATSASAAVLDDFNRADAGTLGSGWTQLAGSSSIVGNTATGSNTALALFNGGSSNTISFDLHLTRNLGYIAAVFGYESGNSFFIKVQGQDGNGADHYGFYVGNNGGGLFSSLSSGGFFDAHVTASYVGTVATLTIDPVGGLQQVYTHDYGFTPGSTSIGLGFYGDAKADNFGSGGSAPAVPESSTWAMMIAGFGAVGFAMRRRQKVALSFA